MRNGNMQHILNILESGDTNRLKELDDNGLNKLINTANFLLESNASLIPYTNLKEFKSAIDNKLLQERTMNMEPSIKFSLDSDGNILITKHESADFSTIYHNSHILLKEYERVNNTEGMKYELCKIYMMVSIINEKYIHNPSILVSKYKQADMAKLKSFIMNDFYKYLRIILDKEKDFNFNDYYSNTQFGIETYKIDNRVIKGLKQILF